ncbi:DNA polymerase III subunit alpha [Fretibacter rubidus]|uniref:DNA polymerase III subunit alpha n=1 Tax=Fretibacter rubidus TaxID=570162 RepID=UPI00352A444D
MAAKPVQFVHLRARTPYSILEGATKIGDMAKRAKEYRMPAIAMTDTHNMCAALEFSGTMVSNGLQPIIGVTLSVDLELDDQPGQLRRDPDGMLVLLAQDDLGYENLMELSSASYLDISPTDLPHIKAARMNGNTDGVIALTGGPDGALNRLICKGQLAEAEAWLDKLAALFPNRLYIELQRHGLAHEIEAEKVLIDWAYAKDLPLVATNEPYFLDPDMHEAHDALLAISEGSYLLEKDRRKVSNQHYFKTSEQMAEVFKDIPEAIENTVDIARRCAVRSVARDPILPNFGDGSLSEGDILAQQARDGLRERLDAVPPADDEQAYFDRLDFELDVIRQMGFPGYFLIVSDFIKWAKNEGIPVGPGRGSGAGSVVAWALTITDLDPLRYGLLFERFLNPERVSMPDFDIDFCQERRGEVIKYVQQKYGTAQVAHIITFGTLQARAVVRDVGRVMQMPLGQVDRLAKLVPSNPASPVTLGEAITMEKGLREARDSEPAVRKLLDVALKLEGLYRNASTHAAGVVIGDRPLTKLVPLYLDPRSEIPATQFTMKYAEKAGLVKFDFLGLKTLTVIDRALKYLVQQGRPIDLDAISTDTPDAYTNLALGLSAGVFQLESSGMRDVLRKMAPDTIEELTALISLYRPGPMKNIDTYIDRKYGRVKIEYPHPSLEDILKETYGIIIYQEQVMQIAQVLSGYSLGEADMLRRAMGKKDQAEMNRQKSRFVDGAVKRNVDAKLASDIFELVNEFAGYGFNKSHAAAYAMISFRTAYLKAVYPTEFIAATMSLDIANVEKLAQFYQEGKRLDLTILPPCVNRSGADFEVTDNAVLYALGALKNVGVEAMRHVVAVREDGGPFKDLFDFARRVDSRIVNKRAIENLARGGAFDCLEPNRAKTLASAGILQSIGSRAAEERQSAQVGLFGDAVDAMAEPDLKDAAPWGNIEQLDHELGAVGFYLGGHPLETYANTTDVKQSIPAIEIEERFTRSGQAVKLAGVVRKRQERMSKRGKRFAYVGISDPTGDFEIFVGEGLLAVSREILTAGAVVVVKAKLEQRDGDIKIFADEIRSLDTTETAPKIAGLKIRLRSATIESLDALEKALESLREAPSENSGYIEIVAPLDGAREGQWRLPNRFGIDPSIQAALKASKMIEMIEEIAA